MTEIGKKIDVIGLVQLPWQERFRVRQTTHVSYHRSLCEFTGESSSMQVPAKSEESVASRELTISSLKPMSVYNIFIPKNKNYSETYSHCRSRRVLSAEVDNDLRDLQNYSYPTKAEFNNCFIIPSK